MDLVGRLFGDLTWMSILCEHHLGPRALSLETLCCFYCGWSSIRFHWRWLNTPPIINQVLFQTLLNPDWCLQMTYGLFFFPKSARPPTLQAKEKALLHYFMAQAYLPQFCNVLIMFQPRGALWKLCFERGGSSPWWWWWWGLFSLLLLFLLLLWWCRIPSRIVVSW